VLIVIVATPGAADANSFVAEAEAIAYAATRLNLAGWQTTTGATATENEKKALIEATRELDRLRYVGHRASSTQRLSWPRVFAAVPDPALTAHAVDAAPLGIVTYGADEIPLALKEATIELAMEFLRAGTTDLAAYPQEADVIRKRVDVIETQWQPGRRPLGLARFPRVLALIAPLLAGAGRRTVVRT